MSTKPFDYLIVGAGLFGAVMARELTDKGLRVLVVERENHVAGMAHDVVIDDIMCSTHGGHIFHTDDKRLWDYVGRFGEWAVVHPKVKVMANGRLYSFPINLATLQQVFGFANMTPEIGRKILKSHKTGKANGDVESWCLANIGPELYETFIRDYTRKQWGRSPTQVPAAVVRRLPVRLTWNDGYFDHQYQGVPVKGFTNLVENMLAGIRVDLGVDYLAERGELRRLADQVIYSGPIDALFDFDNGRLDYRSLYWQYETIATPDFQGCASVNYPALDVPFTRILEFKHFWQSPVEHTVIAREFPTKDGEPLYPVNDARNNERAAQYSARARVAGYILGGRLASYRYFDMHQVIAQALSLVEMLTGAMQT